MSDTPPRRVPGRRRPRARPGGRHAAAGRARCPRRPGGGARAAAGRRQRRAAAAAAPRARRRRTRWRAAFFALAGLAIVAGVGWALLGNRVLVVRSVTVTGTHLLAPGQVIAAADVPLGTPLLSVDAGAVTRRVEAISQVASATVTEDWPDHLVIAVTERVPVMAVADGGRRLRPRGPDRGDRALAKTRPAALPLFVTSLPGSALRGQPRGHRRRRRARRAAALAGAAGRGGDGGRGDGRGRAGDARPAGRQDGSVGRARTTPRRRTANSPSCCPAQVRDIDVSAPGTVVTK